jgi:Ca2+-transporting ATPase
LSIPALASLALGIFLTFSSSRTEGEPSVDWAEGIAIVIAILIVLIVGSLNNWHSREKQFRALNEKNGDRLVKVICDSGGRQIHAHEVVVGDVMLLERGLTIPCDGVFLSGHNVQCNESSATGEPDSIKKLSYEECIALRDKRLTELDPGGPSGDGELLRRADCFIVSGSKVLEGVGTYVVIAVGTKSLGLFIAHPLI